MRPNIPNQQAMHTNDRAFARRSLLRNAAAALLVAGWDAKLVDANEPAALPEDKQPAKTDLKPMNALHGVLDALDRFPLVALAERHTLQEWHDFLTLLLFHPVFPEKVQDIVVEFGNALHQDVADRFVLEGKPVANSDVEQIWRFTVGGGILWDAPVYAQFFRNVRALNRMLPQHRRIRVLLGDPPFDHRKVRSALDKAYLTATEGERDTHYASIVERHVVQKGRRALLIAGSGHLLRGIRRQDAHLNAATLLTQHYPGLLFVIDPLIFPPGPQQDALVHRVQANVAHWTYPALAPLKDSWLGATTKSAGAWINSMSYRANSPGSRRYGSQADAILYVGPSDILTASRPDPSLYSEGPYAQELKRLSQILTEIGNRTDMVSEGLQRAQAGPSFFASV